MAQGEISYVEQDSPGFIVGQIAIFSSYINGRLRKRYGNDQNGHNSLPFGMGPPALIGSGTTPPAVSLQGRPTLGSMQVMLQITTGGALGTALFKWTFDGGITWTIPTATAATVVLGATGLTAVFPAGTYGLDNSYAAAPPVPEILLSWLVALVDYAVMRKRRGNPDDPGLVMFKENADLARDEIKEAADSKDGLFDLPSSEDQDSAVTTASPLGYSETSPYVAFDIEANIATQEDAQSTNVVIQGEQVLI